MMNNVYNTIYEYLVESDKKSIAEKKYKDYVDAHIANVQKAWKEQVSKIDDKFIQEHKSELTKQIKNHDKSKYDPEEFDAYRANYNPISAKEKADNEARFQAAWLHHFQNNNHHWQHWLDEKGNLDKAKYDKDTVMKAYVEMICDWQAMGYVFGDSAAQYYNSNKDKIKIYPELKRWLETILNKLEKENN